MSVLNMGYYVPAAIPLSTTEAVPSTPWPIGQMSILPRHLRLFTVRLVMYPPVWGYVSSSPLGIGMGLIPSLTLPIDSIDQECL